MRLTLCSSVGVVATRSVQPHRNTSLLGVGVLSAFARHRNCKAVVISERRDEAMKAERRHVSEG